MKRVLLVKEQRDGDPYAAVLRSAGYEAAFLPVLTHRLLNIDILREIIEEQRRQPQYSGLVFTSQRAVEAWAEACAKAADLGSTSRWTDLPFYAVGPATAKAIAELSTDVRPSAEMILGAQESGNAAALADFIAGRHKDDANGDPLLYLIGDKTKDTLSSLLRYAKIPLKELQVYETFPSPTIEQDLHTVFSDDNRSFEWLVFFSPSGAKLVLPYFRDGMPKIAAIGPTTREFLKADAGITPSAMAECPTPDALVKALLAADSSSR